MWAQTCASASYLCRTYCKQDICAIYQVGMSPVFSVGGMRSRLTQTKQEAYPFAADAPLQSPPVPDYG